MHAAAMHGTPEILEYLYKRGADIDAVKENVSISRQII